MPPSVEVKIPPQAYPSSDMMPTDEDLIKSMQAVNSQLPLQPAQSDAAGPAVPTMADFNAAVGPQLDAALANLQAGMKKNAEAADAMRKSATDETALAKQIADTPLPPQPKLKDYPELPPDPAKNPAQAFGTVLGAMASLAGLFSRRPMMDTMKAMAGVIRGANQGNQQEREYQMKRYQALADTVQKQNQKEIDQYNAVLSNTKLSVDEKNAQLSAIVHANGDNVAASELEAGGFEKLAALNEKRAGLASQFMTASARLQAVQGMPLDAATTDWLADALHSGDSQVMNWSLGGFGGAARSARLNQIIAATRAKYPDFSGASAAAAIAQYGGEKSAMTSIGHISGAVGQGANEMKKFVVLIKGISDQIDRTQYPDVNSIILAYRKHTGDPLVQQLGNYITDLTAAYSLVLARGGRTTNEARETAAKLADGSMPTAQLDAALQTMQTAADVALQSGTEAMGDISNQISGKSSAAGTSPSGLQNGQTGTSKSGKPMHVENGQWVYD